MKLKWVLAGAALCVLASGAEAGDLSGYFGNTVSCKYANGDVTKIYVLQDGTFTVTPTGHPQSSGRWKDDGSTICYTQTSPPPGADMKQVCNSSQPRAVGDSWSVTDPFGGQCTATLLAGKQ
ncbi:MAG: hypothetical protein WDN08_05235 [Rhizomicrobium sp.]